MSNNQRAVIPPRDQLVRIPGGFNNTKRRIASNLRNAGEPPAVIASVLDVSLRTVYNYFTECDEKNLPYVERGKAGRKKVDHQPPSQ